MSMHSHLPLTDLVPRTMPKVGLAGGISAALLIDDYRVCLYDRRNVGSSETVDAVQTPGDVVRDMSAVLKPAARSRRTSCGRLVRGLVARPTWKPTPTT